MKHLLPIVIVCAAVATACSNRQMYQGLQAGKRQQCLKLPEPDRARCLESAGTGYDDYQREREKIKPD
ncbi:MAG: hypothetical protein OEY03_09865 [Rhizobacter sp.]|nr:hypothetical protein [Rhizobacter sp.]